MRASSVASFFPASGWPLRGEPLVASPAKQESVGADRLVERDLAHILAGRDQADPASAAEALVTGRILDDPVERHVLADDDLSHLGFPFLSVSRTGFDGDGRFVQIGAPVGVEAGDAHQGTRARTPTRRSVPLEACGNRC
jgi:hypothetical protein